jgi:hypothetical protein
MEEQDAVVKFLKKLVEGNGECVATQLRNGWNITISPSPSGQRIMVDKDDIKAFPIALEQRLVEKIDESVHRITLAGKAFVSKSTAKEHTESANQEEPLLQEQEGMLGVISNILSGGRIDQKWDRKDLVKFALGRTPTPDQSELALRILADSDVRTLTEQVLKENKILAEKTGELSRETKRLADQTALLAKATVALAILTLAVAATPWWEHFLPWKKDANQPPVIQIQMPTPQIKPVNAPAKPIVIRQAPKPAK